MICYNNHKDLTQMHSSIENWLKRHRNKTNLYLHMLGIPACFVVAPIMLIFYQWIFAGVFFVAGYALQFTGHLVEGNKSGEEMLIRRILGKK